ncbi:MAG: hypothetical protein GXO19_04310 [Epsilonproteobacteria bacterium]|nr:hypothetical protein [Campylobacterota bacterium]NPA56945.1 hypothetical protein [Campylobacterota bacterium]
MRVIKRNGRVEPLDISKIQKYTKAACDGLEGVSQSELEVDARIQFRDGITTEEIQQTLIRTAVDKIDVDRPNWTFVAARLFLYDLYHKVSGFTGYLHLRDYFERGEREGRILPGLKDKYDLDDLNDYIKPERDLQFTYLGIRTLYDRYLLKDKENRPIELPQQLFMAVAMFLAQNELDCQGWAKRFYDVISKFEVMVATPTLSNARTTRHQLSSCYIGSTPDNIEGIFDAYKEMALLSKFGGGIGWDWSQVRALGSYIDSHKNAAGGIIPFLKITNDIAIAVDQLGTRKGAIAVYIEPWHMDIRDFIDLKKNSGEERRRAHDLFPALWINDLFMKRVAEDGIWTLFDPYEVSDLTEVWGEEFERRYEEYERRDDIIKEQVKAKELWKLILRSYFETGNPFLCFKDNANRCNPNEHYGIIRSSNLCVTGDTRLATQFGLVRADELEKMGEELLATYDLRTDGEREERGVGVAPCLKMYKTKENAEVYRVTTRDGYGIKATPWHEFYTVREGEVVKLPLRELKEGDLLLIQSARGQFGSEGSYELGFIAGVVAGSRGYSDGTVAGPESDEVLEEAVWRAFGKVTGGRECGVVPTSRSGEISEAVQLQIGEMGEVLEEFGLRGEMELQVPEFVFRGREECVRGYLQGLFTSRGSVQGGEGLLLELPSPSRKFLEEVQLLLSNFGIKSTLSVEEGRGGGVGREELPQLSPLRVEGESALLFLQEIGFMGSKQGKAWRVVEESGEFAIDGYGRKGYFETEIEKIEFLGYEDVYDTTQLYNHSLIFNGIVTGNCTEIFQNTEPNRYRVRVEYEDGSYTLFDEEEDVTTDQGIVKKAKKITSLDTIGGKQVFIVEKVPLDGSTAVCNLASINLSKVHTKEDIERVVPIAVRMLDNVIDLNFYPLKKVKVTNQRSRSIGLGVMGEAQMLAEQKIRWGSDDHFHKIDEIMEMISYNAIRASSNLAVEKGRYPEFEGSRWSRGIMPIDSANEEAKMLTPERGGLFGYIYDWNELREKVKRDGMRNGYLMAIAPTSSISILTGTTQTIEPVYKRKWFEENLSGLIPVVVPNLNPETWEYYTPAYDLDQRLLIQAAAVRQKWIDQGQSVNIFIRLDKASGRYLHEIYTLAWRLGLKSTYYLRSQSPEIIQDVADRSMECEGCQ